MTSCAISISARSNKPGEVTSREKKLLKHQVTNGSGQVRFEEDSGDWSQAVERGGGAQRRGGL